MRKVSLRMNEQEKYEVIKELVDHNGNKIRAATKLNISRRQIDRLTIIYKEKVNQVLFMGIAIENQLKHLINLSLKILYYFIKTNTMILILIILKSI